MFARNLYSYEDFVAQCSQMMLSYHFQLERGIQQRTAYILKEKKSIKSFIIIINDEL